MKTPPYFEFQSKVQIFAGSNSLEKIGKDMEIRGVSRPMILSSQTVARSGLLNFIEKGYRPGMETGVIDTDIPADSDLETVRRLAALFTEKACDCLIAVGGGSVIDTAKGVNIAVSLSCSNYDITPYAGAGMVREKLKPLTVVPTTSGSGSEATIVAVIADTAQSKKLLFTSPYLLPNTAVLDPRVTLSLPPLLTAQTGMDALTHACEAFFCLAHNPISDAFALEAIRTIVRYLPTAVAEPSNEEARLQMAIASNLAGTAFSNSMVGMVHSIGHTVGAIAHVPHGACMAILLPYAMEYNARKAGERIGALLTALENEKTFLSTPKEKRTQAAASSVRRLNEKLKTLTNGAHALCFKDYRSKNGEAPVTRELLPRIANEAINDGSIFYNPEELSKADALRVLEAAYEGVPLN